MTDQRRDIGLVVPTQQVDEIWPMAEDFIARCDTYRSHSSDMLELARSGQCQLWIVLRGLQVAGAGMTEIVTYPKAKVVTIHTLGGDSVDWNAAIEDVEKFAKLHDCTHIEIHGRRGWLRAIGGYEEKFTTIGKAL